MKRPTLNAPDRPYTFSELVHVLEKDLYYARGLHELVKYAHQNDGNSKKRNWAKRELSKHVKHLSKEEVDDLGHSDPDDDKCSNNTKFYMFDFIRYI